MQRPGSGKPSRPSSGMTAGGRTTSQSTHRPASSVGYPATEQSIGSSAETSSRSTSAAIVGGGKQQAHPQQQQGQTAAADTPQYRRLYTVHSYGDDEDVDEDDANAAEHLPPGIRSQHLSSGSTADPMLRSHSSAAHSSGGRTSKAETAASSVDIPVDDSSSIATERAGGRIAHLRASTSSGSKGPNNSRESAKASDGSSSQHLPTSSGEILASLKRPTRPQTAGTARTARFKQSSSSTHAPTAADPSQHEDLSPADATARSTSRAGMEDENEEHPNYFRPQSAMTVRRNDALTSQTLEPTGKKKAATTSVVQPSEAVQRWANKRKTSSPPVVQDPLPVAPTAEAKEKKRASLPNNSATPPLLALATPTTGSASRGQPGSSKRQSTVSSATSSTVQSPSVVLAAIRSREDSVSSVGSQPLVPLSPTAQQPADDKTVKTAPQLQGSILHRPRSASVTSGTSKGSSRAASSRTATTTGPRTNRSAAALQSMNSAKGSTGVSSTGRVTFMSSQAKRKEQDKSKVSDSARRLKMHRIQAQQRTSCNVIGKWYKEQTHQAVIRKDVRTFYRCRLLNRKIVQRRNAAQQRFRRCVWVLLRWMRDPRLRFAASKIKALWKGWTARKKQRQLQHLRAQRIRFHDELREEERLFYAARVIQRIWRRSVAREDVSAYFTVRHSHKLRTIQRAFRASQYRTLRKQVRSQVEDRNNGAAKVIQRAFRRHIYSLDRRMNLFRRQHFPHHPDYFSVEVATKKKQERIE